MGEVAEVRANSVLQFGSLTIAVLSLASVPIPAVGLSLAIASMLFGLLIPPRSGRIRTTTIVLIGAALIANVVALLMALPPLGTAAELEIKPG